jgi:hypothetical protein
VPVVVGGGTGAGGVVVRGLEWWDGVVVFFVAPVASEPELPAATVGAAVTGATGLAALAVVLFRACALLREVDGLCADPALLV